MDNTSQTNYVPPPPVAPQHVCPCCGYCPHCGRGGYARPYYPYYPYPIWVGDPNTTGGWVTGTITGAPTGGNVTNTTH